MFTFSSYQQKIIQRKEKEQLLNKIARLHNIQLLKSQSQKQRILKQSAILIQKIFRGWFTRKIINMVKLIILLIDLAQIKLQAKAEQQKLRLQEQALRRQELSKIPTHRTEEYRELLECQLEDLDNAVSFVGFGVDSETLVSVCVKIQRVFRGFLNRNKWKRIIKVFRAFKTCDDIRIQKLRKFYLKPTFKTLKLAYQSSIQKEAEQKKALATLQAKRAKKKNKYSNPISRKNSDKKNLSTFLASPLSPSNERREIKKIGKLTPSDDKNHESKIISNQVTESKIAPKYDSINSVKRVTPQKLQDKTTSEQAGSIDAKRLTTETQQQSKATNSICDADLPLMKGSSATLAATPSFKQFTNPQQNDKFSLSNLSRFASQSQQMNLKNVVEQEQIILNNPVTAKLTPVTPLLLRDPKQEAIRIQSNSFSQSVTPIMQNKFLNKNRKSSLQQNLPTFKPQIIRNYKFRRPYQSVFKCQHIIPSCVECKPTTCQPSFTYGEKQNYVISHVKQQNKTPSRPNANISTSSMFLTIPGLVQDPGVVDFQRRMQEDLDKRQFKSFINGVWPLDGRVEGMLHPDQRSAIVDHFVGRYFGYGKNKFNSPTNQSSHLIPIRKTPQQLSRLTKEKQSSIPRSSLLSRKEKRANKNQASPSRQHLIQWQQWCSGEIQLPNSDLLDHDYGKVVEEYQNYKESKQKQIEESKKASSISVNHDSIKKLVQRSIKTPNSISSNRRKKKKFMNNSALYSTKSTATGARNTSIKNRFDPINYSTIKANQITNLMNNTSQLNFNHSNYVKSDPSSTSQNAQDFKGLTLQINTNSQYLNSQSIPSFISIEQQSKTPYAYQQQPRQLSPSQTSMSKKPLNNSSIPPKNVLITQQDLALRSKPLSPASRLQAMKKHVPQGRDLSAPPLQYFEIPENIRRAYTGKSEGKINSFSAQSSKLDLEQILDSRLKIKGIQGQVANNPCNVSADNLIRIAESQSNNTLIHQGYLLKSQPHHHHHHPMLQSQGKLGFIFRSGDIEQIDQKIEQEGVVAAVNALKIQRTQSSKRPSSYNTGGIGKHMYRNSHRFGSRGKSGRINYNQRDENYLRGRQNFDNTLSNGSLNSQDMGMLFSPASNQSSIQIKTMTFEESHPELAKIINKFPGRGPRLKNGSGGSGAVLEKQRKSPRQIRIQQKQDDQRRFLKDGGYKIHNSLFIKRIG